MAKEHVFMTNFNGNPNVGLYAYANDKVCLVGNSVPQKQFGKLSEILETPVLKANIAGTSMLGVFCAGNSSCILVPQIAFEDELEALRKAGLQFKVIDTRLTALGNTILCNDHGAIASPDWRKRLKQIESALKVKVTHGKDSGLDNVGSLA
jgi:translation initiation factor 6